MKRITKNAGSGVIHPLNIENIGKPTKSNTKPMTASIAMIPKIDNAIDFSSIIFTSFYHFWLIVFKILAINLHIFSHIYFVEL